MRFRNERDPPSAWERIARRVRHCFEREQADGPPGPQTPLEEPVLVALAAIHRCHERWLDNGFFLLKAWEIADLLKIDYADRIPDNDDRAKITARLNQSLRDFNTRFPNMALLNDEARDRERIERFHTVMALDRPASSERSATAQAPAGTQGNGAPAPDTPRVGAERGEAGAASRD